jgi:tetratricopeptide (TPR) repeat protein
MDPKRQQASNLASEALSDTQAGRFVEAEPKLRAAVELAVSTRHHSLPMFRRQLADVLTELERDSDALLEYELSVRDALEGFKLDSSGVVSACRYFLGEHLLFMERPEEALQAILPSLSDENPHGPLRLVEALARWRIGELAQARAAADLALQYAHPIQVEEFSQRLAELEQGGEGS